MNNPRPKSGPTEPCAKTPILKADVLPLFICQTQNCTAALTPEVPSLTTEFYKFGSYLKRNTIGLHCEDSMVSAV